MRTKTGCSGCLKTALNHLSINVSDKEQSFLFYKDLLTYLGYKIVRDNGISLGMRNKDTDIWLRETTGLYKKNKYHRKNTGLNHIAFGVSKKEHVDKFYQEFLKPRGIIPLYNTPKHFPEYTKEYYAVYFEDPDRIKLEVVYL